MGIRIERFGSNPLFCAADIAPSRPDFTVIGVLNPGAFRWNGRIGLVLRVAEQPAADSGELAAAVCLDGEYRLLRVRRNDPAVRCNDPRIFFYRDRACLTSISHLLVAWSDDGGISFEPDYSLRIFPAGPYETYGIEDCRVEFFEGRYILTYSAVSEFGVGIGTASTEDWKEFTPHRLLLHPHNKDCALLPRRIGGCAWMLHRPSGIDLGGNFIWLSESADLEHWGGPRCLAATRPGMWDSERIGAGASPLETDAGWLEIYHGADRNGRYSLGALLLDRNAPAHVIARSEAPLMEPASDYEMKGFYHDCIFTNGQIAEGDRLRLYYGAADSVVCGADLSVSEIIASLK
ncbi:MAG: glycosidase [Lentisphaeria bacterium]|nr:glycosidase [Lentisphaeria bacterium]